MQSLSLRYLLLGDAYASGTLMNPATGYPYLTPVVNPKPGEKVYDYPIIERLNLEDGFQYASENAEKLKPHALTTATLYTTRYFLVHNHRAATMMQASHPNDVAIADFTGTPIKGKKGGFATGPQEQMTLVGLGAERFNFEISQFRSEFGTMDVVPNDDDEKDDDGNDEKDDDTIVVPASKTLKRTLDELRQYKIQTGLKIIKCNSLVEKEND